MTRSSFGGVKDVTQVLVASSTNLGIRPIRYQTSGNDRKTAGSLRRSTESSVSQEPLSVGTGTSGQDGESSDPCPTGHYTKSGGETDLKGGQTHLLRMGRTFRV